MGVDTMAEVSFRFQNNSVLSTICFNTYIMIFIDIRWRYAAARWRRRLQLCGWLQSISGHYFWYN